MKKIVFVLLLLAACLCSCAGPKVPEEHVSFYYRSADSAFKEGLYAEHTSEFKPEDDPRSAVLSYFLQLQTLTNGVSPFTKGTKLVNTAMESNVLTVRLSAESSQLTGIDASFALSCLAKTFLQFNDVRQLSVYAEQDDGTSILLGTMQDGTFLFEDNTSAKVLMQHSIYFPDTENRYLIPVTESTEQKDISQLVFWCISKLQTVPKSQSIHRVYPQSAKLSYVDIVNGICYLDFSDGFMSNRPTDEQELRLLLLSITDTLTEIEGIDAVQFLMNGETIQEYGAYNLSVPFTRDTDCIGPVRSGFNETDVTLSLIHVSSGEPCEVPWKLKTDTPDETAEILLQDLLNYKTQNDCMSPVSTDHAEFSVAATETECTVIFSSDILSQLNCDKQSFEQSIFNTLSSIDRFVKTEIIYK